MKKTLFIKNAAVLTASAVALRLLGTVFKVWVSAKIGSAGMGLYQLIFSVFVFVSSFAQSGISTAVTKLTAAAVSRNENPAGILRKSIVLTEIIAVFSALMLFLFSSFTAEKIIGDASAAPAVKILCLILPVIGVCSCIRGYFIAVRCASPCALSQIIEQAIRIAVSFLLVSKFMKYGVSVTCGCLVAGDATAEAVCCVYLFLRYKGYIKKHKFGLHKPKNIYRRIISFALPISAGRYLGSLLRTAENILIPKQLSKSGGNYKSGLSVFGGIKAMALPVLLFPCALLNSVSLLLVPELSAAKSKCRQGVIRCITEEIIKLTMVFSCIFAAIFGVAGKEIGMLLYKDSTVGVLLCILSPIVPLMYLDSVADGILKGLDCQNFCFFVGIADSGIRVILILLTLNKFGIAAFIIIMYFSNFFTAFLNTGKLIKVSHAAPDIIKTVFIPLISAIVITKATALLLRGFAADTLVYIILLCFISLLLYFAALFLFGVLNGDDIRAVIR